jgi:hypothetical protein
MLGNIHLKMYQALHLWFVLKDYSDWTCWRNKQLWRDKTTRCLLRQTSKAGNDRNQNLCKFYVKIVVCMNPKTELNTTLVQHRYSMRCWNFKPNSGRFVQITWRNSFYWQCRSSLCKELSSHSETSIKCQCILVSHPVKLAIIQMQNLFS